MPSLVVKSLDAGSRVARGAVTQADGALRIPLARKVLLGRSDACDVVVHSSRLAPRDTVFEPSPEGWVARTLGRHPGLLVNGERVFSKVLKAGDVIFLQGMTLEFSDADAL
jgi:pSer/pThr/pTyr-binding forkhead associated (FHA) protein